MGDTDASSDEEETLLASPDKKYDESYLTPGSKGKRYTQVAVDKRPSGARKRHMQGQFSKEMGSSTSRNINKGYSDLKSLARGIYEELETNYHNEDDIVENKVLESNKEIQLMLESLSKIDLSKTKINKMEQKLND